MKPRTSSPISNATPIKRNSPGVATSWDIVHACGHAWTHDLSSRAADQRASFARWLTGRDCTDCWRTTRPADTAGREEWLAARRAAEQQTAAEWAKRFGMPPLEGPEKILGWAERCRHQLVTAAHTALVAEGTWDEADWADLEEKARTVTRGGWWLDQRESEAADLPELLNAATESDRGTENPFL
ncbi:hypothetical protein AB0G74_22205 [Streptomyces sp. NPDC020875]|uniref:hypothetical protein n=1 Tax=Streptomyces sp. NPDC020875 TaxID=3154898 RepID=UPI00340FDC7F